MTMSDQMNMLVSIIVPVYNVENFLEQCLKSIENQSYTNWEAWLVDDGSTDTSGKICDDYAEKNSKFHVIHKENGGQSSARNVALDHITGDLVTFLFNRGGHSESSAAFYSHHGYRKRELTKQMRRACRRGRRRYCQCTSPICENLLDRRAVQCTI